ncbi:MAG TPA: hypothetical protein PKE63_08750 [Lacibacter sp.]|nr:hypothetical protein [Lacibacter sp.]HMO87899.1 hypothetical protein [Lacibacter sp.]HMP87352.1 hypothetical protein [Lacibacter sp.]
MKLFLKLVPFILVPAVFLLSHTSLLDPGNRLYTFVGLGLVLLLHGYLSVRYKLAPRSLFLVYALVAGGLVALVWTGVV